ncbi:MAG: hypothetical protein ACOH2F_05835 [Cellulomonas sp.]
MSLATRLTVLAGPTVPLPLPEPFISRLRSAHVSESDEARSAFSLTFDAGRSGPAAVLDTPMLTGSPLRPGARVSLVLTVGAIPTVLADGFVTRVELTPGQAAGGAQLTVFADDVSWLLDQEEVNRDRPLDDYPQVLAILGPYAAHGVVPMTIPPLDMDPPIPIERVPQQRDTDFQHLSALALAHGYVTYAIAGPLPAMSTFYWGPPIRVGLPQPAITIDQPPYTNVTSAPTFRLDATTPVQVQGRAVDPRTGATVPVRSVPPLRLPLSALPLWLTNASDSRVRLVEQSGSSTIGTLARAQAEAERGADAVVATGELDGSRYGGVLRPRGLVGMRGAGWSHDGLWYVRRVEHQFAPGSYKQSFTLARDGYGSTVPAVLP